MQEKILTLHPEGKQGVNLSKRRYDQIKSAIVDVLNERGALTYTELTKAIENRLNGKFDGKIPWYVVTVKLDLEARGVIERVPKTSPPKLRLA